MTKVCTHLNKDYRVMKDGTAKCSICGAVKSLDVIKSFTQQIWVVTQTPGFDFGNSSKDDVVAAFVSKEAAQRWAKENPADKPLVNCITNVKLELR